MKNISVRTALGITVTTNENHLRAITYDLKMYFHYHWNVHLLYNNIWFLSVLSSVLVNTFLLQSKKCYWSCGSEWYYILWEGV